MTDGSLPSAPTAPQRAIRSFVKRGGRITPAQSCALAELWPRYGIDYDGRPLDLDAAFGRSAAHTLEIGFGDGETLIALAATHPARDFVGIEGHAPGVGQCLLRAAAAGLNNLRVIRHDAVEVLQHAVPGGSIDEILIYFPDPWPKKRHHKRRLIQPGFVELLASRLAAGARLRLATDWQPYADRMREVVDARGAFENVAGRDGYVPRPPARPLTKFERRGQRLGHATRDLEYVRR